MAQAYRCPSCRHKFVPEQPPNDGRLQCPACRAQLKVPVRSPTPSAASRVQIAGYQVLRRIGQGATAVVYEAIAPNGDRVALKVLNKEASRDDEFRARFQREARLAAQIIHPHIVAVSDCGEERGVLYLAMELMDGGSLEDEIERQRRIPWQQALVWIQQIAEALQAAGTRGIVHRDIKPANIMFTHDKRTAKLTDLGFGKQSDATSQWEQQLTMAGVSMGSPAYMPPEQVTDALTADARSDIYSLGATFYHAVTGKVPFGGKDVHQIMRDVLRVEPVPPRQHVPDLPAGVDACIRWMMQKDPARRPQHATQLLYELRALAERPQDARRFEKLMRSSRRVPAWLIIVGVILGLLAVAAAVVFALR
ncbi:MAG: serine/threonine protein kinase [Planctomycetota bacterium]|nr:serine/threonine protein kinase [Planctomycetota bacterium]